MSHNVLYLSYDGMTDPLGQSQVLPYLFGLTTKGFSFQLISFEKKDQFLQHGDHIQKLCSENNVHWHPLTYTKSPPLLSTIYDVNRMKLLAHKLHRENNFEIIHCRSYLSSLVGLEMKNRYQIKFLFDMRGFWADERIDGKIWNIKNPIYKRVYNFFKRKEKIFFQQADHIISLTFAGKEEICSWKGFSGIADKIEVIPCCADLSKFNPQKINEEQRHKFANRLSLSKNDFILGYVGSIGTWYMLEEMLQYFNFLLKEKPSAIFLFVTGESPVYLKKKALEFGIDSDKIRVISARHQDVAACISLFTASIFFIRPTYSKKASSPTKQGELMAMGIPLICNDGVGDTAKVVQDYQAGYALKGFSTKDFETINIEFPNFNNIRCRQGAQEFYSLSEGISRYHKVYAKLLSIGN
jgi:glycosyltransferase involved in cell wall biosynthesis